MPWRFLEDAVTSDLTFRASGRDLAELFTAAADATASAMVEPVDAIASRVAIPIAIDADGLDLLLVRFLEELVYRKDAAGLLLRAGGVRVEQVAGGVHLAAELRGEPIDRARHRLLADVKAVTHHALHVHRTAAGWEVEVTLDV